MMLPELILHIKSFNIKYNYVTFSAPCTYLFFHLKLKHPILRTNSILRAVGSSPGVGRLIDQSVDAPEGSEVEARCAIILREARKNFFHLHFQLSGWALVALSYFED